MISELNKQDVVCAEKLWQISERSYLHGSPWSLEQFRQDLVHENSRYLIFMRENHRIGFISYYQVLDELDISHIVIDKDNQQQGFGRQMLEEAIRYWRKNELVRVLLEVRESNHGAQALYESLGFRCIHKRKKYYHHPQEDGWVMELIL